MAVAPSNVADWCALLDELASRLDRGRIYDRDLSRLCPPLTTLISSFNRRHQQE